MTRRSFTAALLGVVILAVACSKKPESIARTEVSLQDSLVTSEVSDDTLDEFEYEADSLETEENDN